MTVQEHGPLLVGSGMVLDRGDGPQLCVGPIAATMPPIGGGPTLVGWVWPDEGVETFGGSTWAYAMLTGWFDGTTFTVDRVLDPGVSLGQAPRPRRRPERVVADDELEQIQHAAMELPGACVAGRADGVVEVEVVHDDGSLQARMDSTHGVGVVQVTSYLVPAPASLR